MINTSRSIDLYRVYLYLRLRFGFLFSEFMPDADEDVVHLPIFIAATAAFEFLLNTFDQDNKLFEEVVAEVEGCCCWPPLCFASLLSAGNAE